MSIKPVNLLCILLFFSFSSSKAQDLENIRISGFYSEVPLPKLFLKIEAQCDYKFQYNLEDVQDIKRTLIIDNLPLDNTIESMLKGTSLQYEVKDKVIEIFKEGDYHKKASNPTKQNFTLSGKVIDAESGETLPFAQIVIRESKKGITSNVDGYFTLFKVPSDTSTLIVLYVGYETE